MAENIIELLEAEVEIEIPFHDVDMMCVTWHGNYARYLEVARCKLLDNIQFNYLEMTESGYVWPIIDMRLRYVKPSRFGQKIRVSAKVVEWENRLRIDYVIRDAKTGERLTKARTDQVAVNTETGEMSLSSPDILLQKLGVLQR